MTDLRGPMVTTLAPPARSTRDGRVAMAEAMRVWPVMTIMSTAQRDEVLHLVGDGVRCDPHLNSSKGANGWSVWISADAMWRVRELLMEGEGGHSSEDAARRAA